MEQFLLFDSTRLLRASLAACIHSAIIIGRGSLALRSLRRGPARPPINRLLRRILEDLVSLA